MSRYKASIIKPATGINVNHRKPDKFSKSYMVIDKSFNELVDCRIYQTGNRFYCCLWVSTKDDYRSGSGYAGGYGYCKESAAVQAAISQAGYKLTYPGNKKVHCSIAGVGQTAIRAALLAIARMRTKRTLHVIECYG